VAQSDVGHFPSEAAGAYSGTWDWLAPAAAGPTQGAGPASPLATQGGREAMQIIRSERWPMVSPSHRAAGTTPTMAIARKILAAWRAAERELGELPDGSPDRPLLQGMAERFRLAYHSLFDERHTDPEGD
jgi:hypothetical protein